MLTHFLTLTVPRSSKLCELCQMSRTCSTTGVAQVPVIRLVRWFAGIFHPADVLGDTYKEIDWIVPYFNVKGLGCHKCPKRKKFWASLRGAFLIQILLGVTDRHSGNIMISENCEVLSVDFGHFLRHFPESEILNKYNTFYNPYLDEYLKRADFQTDDIDRFKKALAADLNIIQKHMQQNGNDPELSSLKSWSQRQNLAPWEGKIARHHKWSFFGEADTDIPKMLSKFVKMVFDDATKESTNKNSWNIENGRWDNVIQKYTAEDMPRLEMRIGMHMVGQYYERGKQDYSPQSVLRLSRMNMYSRYVKKAEEAYNMDTTFANKLRTESIGQNAQCIDQQAQQVGNRRPDTRVYNVFAFVDMDIIAVVIVSIECMVSVIVFAGCVYWKRLRRKLNVENDRVVVVEGACGAECDSV